MKLDATDQQILDELSRDGRITNVELADRVALSPSACLRRVQELERSGIIVGYKAEIDHKALGIGFVAYLTVRLTVHTKESQGAFEDTVRNIAEVRECHNVTGNIEYILKVEVADIGAYKHFHTEIIGALPHVASLSTYVVLNTSKN